MYIVAKRKWRYPLSIEREYAKILVAYVKQKIQTIKTFLPDLEALAQNYNAASTDVLLDLIARKTQDAGNVYMRASNRTTRQNLTAFVIASLARDWPVLQATGRMRTTCRH